jgi:hypothetical protein
VQLPTARLVWVLQAVVPAAQLQPGGIELREVGAVAKAPSNTQDIAPRGAGANHPRGLEWHADDGQLGWLHGHGTE